jgi:cytoskeletal protein RodZ
MPVKKSTRSKASATSKKPAVASRARSNKSKRPFNSGTMLIAAMCVAGAVIALAAHEMTPARRVASTETVPDDVSTASGEPKPTATSMRADEPVGSTTRATDTTETNASSASMAPVTIFGCLEQSNNTYRLTDTDGVDAPRARSWKTGFLKKGNASVEVVDPANRAHLSSQIGHRVGVTGTLSDRQLQVRSIRKISSSCGN